MAAPVGFSVNSDAPAGDSLYSIDLANGSSTLIGKVTSSGTIRLDVEGLALSPGGTLWGVDEESLKLFPLSQANGQIGTLQEEDIVGLNASVGNDFGMTFTCTGELFVTSVSERALYRLGLDGSASKIGDLGANISSLASMGNPARLYGLGNGLLSEAGPQDNRSLYEIDPNTGIATLVGNIGPAAADYLQTGLSFDADGNLWAITDRAGLAGDQGSQILRLDRMTGLATLVATTTETGFESRAIAPPGNCSPVIDPPAPAPTPAHLLNSIPVLSPAGKLAATLLLAMVGLVVLRRRSSAG
jgi:hypothetical protein